MNKQLRYQLLKYGLVGGGAAALHYFVAMFLVFQAGLGLQWANLAGFTSGFAFSYAGQCFYTFKSTATISNFAGYILLGCINYFLSFISLHVLASYLPYWASLGLVILLVPIIGFLVGKYFLFRK